MLKCTVTLDALGAHMLGESLYFVSRDTGHYVEATKVVEDPIAATVLVPGKMQLIDVNDLQVSLARSHGETLRETARQLGMKVVGDLVPCAGCSGAKKGGWKFRGLPITARPNPCSACSWTCRGRGPGVLLAQNT